MENKIITIKYLLPKGSMKLFTVEGTVAPLEVHESKKTNFWCAPKRMVPPDKTGQMSEVSQFGSWLVVRQGALALENKLVRHQYE